MSAVLSPVVSAAVFAASPRPPAVLASAGDLMVHLVEDSATLDQSLSLRHRVFGQEWGAKVGADDRDEFDDLCEHLVVTDAGRGRVVGTYRLLSPEGARRAGGYYSDREFDLGALDAVRGVTAELGRSCVDPAYRNGTVILLLWAGLGQLLARRRWRYLIGCASVPMADGGRLAAALYRSLARTHLSDPWLRAYPRDPLPTAVADAGTDATAVVVPALIKGYLRAGGQVMGEPHVDRAFGCVDLPMILEVDRTDARYLRRFVPGRSAAAA